MPAEIFSLTNTAGAVIVICPISAAHVREADSGTGIGCMQELAGAGIDTHVGNTGCTTGACKEDDVAGL